MPGALRKHAAWLPLAIVVGALLSYSLAVGVMNRWWMLPGRSEPQVLHFAGGEDGESQTFLLTRYRGLGMRKYVFEGDGAHSAHVVQERIRSLKNDPAALLQAIQAEPLPRWVGDPRGAGWYVANGVGWPLPCVFDWRVNGAIPAALGAPMRVGTLELPNARGIRWWALGFNALVCGVIIFAAMRVVFAVLGAVRGMVRIRRGCCWGCGYALSMPVPVVCSECGRVIRVRERRMFEAMGRAAERESRKFEGLGKGARASLLGAVLCLVLMVVSSLYQAGWRSGTTVVMIGRGAIIVDRIVDRSNALLVVRREWMTNPASARRWCWWPKSVEISTSMRMTTLAAGVPSPVVLDVRRVAAPLWLPAAVLLILPAWRCRRLLAHGTRVPLSAAAPKSDPGVSRTRDEPSPVAESSTPIAAIEKV